MVKKRIENIDAFANSCGYFYNAYIKYGIIVNSGYNCSHPDQKETHTENGKKVGCCYSWSCPLACKADEEDFNDPEIDNQGFDFKEMQYVVTNLSGINLKFPMI